MSTYSLRRAATSCGSPTGGARATAHQPDAGPQVRTDHQPVAPSAVQRGHAGLADRVHASVVALRGGDVLVGQVADEPVGVGPASALDSRTITCRRTPKRSARPCRAARRRTSAIFSATAAGGSPQVR